MGALRNSAYDLIVLKNFVGAFAHGWVGNKWMI